MVKSIVAKLNIDVDLPVPTNGGVLGSNGAGIPPYEWDTEISCSPGEMIGRALNAPPGSSTTSNVKPITTIAQSGVPDTDQVPEGHCCIWIDTDDSKMYFCCNRSSTIKKVEMT
jgi:hypothetical protein